MKKYKSCKFDKVNRCQKKDSGGHPGTIKSVKKKYCAKATENIQDKELQFYIKNCGNKKREICNFIPKYGGICVDNKLKYIVLENLTKDMSNSWIMDVKIGKRTASYSQLIGKKRKISSLKKLRYLSKKYRHNIQDLITTSDKYGFRSEQLPSKKIQGLFRKMRIGMLNPQKMLSIYFEKDKKNIALKNIIKKFTKLNKFIQSEEFNDYSFVGTSILFIYDNTKNKRDNVNLSIIDFKRTRQSKRMTKNEKKYREFFREGTNNLLKELNKFRDSKN
jgi:hypothetical protein